ncbi:MAG: acetyltransferase [Chloroflexia bacterium]
MSKAAVIFGAGRQGRVVLAILRALGQEVRGFLDDDRSRCGEVVDGVPVLGGIEWIQEQAGLDVSAVVAVGSNEARVVLGDRLRALGIELLNAVHPSAVVEPGVTMGSGNVICPGAVVVTGTRLEDDVLINTGATVDHDCWLETGSQIAPGVHTAGCVHVGRLAFVGLGAVLGPRVTIGERTIVGAGAVVLDDLPPRVLAFGTPARVIRQIEEPLDWRKILGGG